VRAYISEPNLGKIYPGMEVEVTNDTDPDRPYRGQIGFISPVAEFTPKSVETPELRTDLVYRLRVIIEQADAALRQGMPVTVRIPLEANAARGES
jgi:HlyD family secretion protein